METTETLDKMYLEYSNVTDAKTAKELSLEQTIKELTELVQLMGGVVRFYESGQNKRQVRKQGGIIEYDVDAGPLYNYYYVTEDVDGGKRAREIQNNELFKKYYKGEK